MPHRNAARVLPEPVGASTSVWSPAAIAGHPCRCASVGAANVVSNHACTGGEKANSARFTVKTLKGGCDSETPRLLAVTEYQSPEWHPAFEEYCEAVFERREDDVNVIQARIAERLNVSRPAVSEMIKRMEAAGLVELSGSSIGLTAAGMQLAERVVRRHRLAERLLTDLVGPSWAEAPKAA